MSVKVHVYIFGKENTFMTSDFTPIFFIENHEHANILL